ncbi:MAG: hypothetical protein CJBNEKGG_03082 [Prosthecobacter sp.]|nr:hypothetical protein [Prosthecobacter sp.]
MKTKIIILGVLVVASLGNILAEDITLKDGTVLAGAKIMKFDGSEVRIMHNGGIAKVGIKALPDDLQKKVSEMPGSQPTNPANPAATQTPKIADQPTTRAGQAASPAVILISGDNSSGSGFIVNTGGKTYLYTAAHVLTGMDKPTFKTPEGIDVKIPSMNSLEISDDPKIVDVVRIPLAGALPPGFQLATDAAVDDDIVAYGNSGGESVVTALNGKIVGIGPNEIEVDAKVVPGNSGGPIVRKGTNSIVGLVTRAVKKPTDIWIKDTPFEGVRRFAARPERVAKWTQTTLHGLREQGKRIERMRTETLAIAAVLDLDYFTDGVDAPTIQKGDFSVREVLKLAAPTKVGATVNGAVATLNATLRANSSIKLAEVASKQAYGKFFGDIYQAAKSGVTDMSKSDFFQYNREAYQVEVDLRKEVTAEMLKIAREVHGASF